MGRLYDITLGKVKADIPGIETLTIKPDLVRLNKKEIHTYAKNSFEVGLGLSGYECGGVKFYWISQKNQARINQGKMIEMKTEGWQVHIAIKDLSEYAYAVENLLPEFCSMDIVHEILAPDIMRIEKLNMKENRDEINRKLLEQRRVPVTESTKPVNAHEMFDIKKITGLQIHAGKTITIYPDNIRSLNGLSDEVKAFLKIDNGVDILTDKHLGGKVFTSYDTFRYIPGNTTNLYSPFSGIGDYRPFIAPDEPVSIYELFGAGEYIYTDSWHNFVSDRENDLYNTPLSTC